MEFNSCDKMIKKFSSHPIIKLWGILYEGKKTKNIFENKFLPESFFNFQNFSPKYSSHLSTASSSNKILHASLRPGEFFKSSC